MQAFWFGACLVGLVGCDADAKLCRERMQSAQAVVAQVDGKSAASVEQSLTAVSEAHAACEKAKLGSEREQLLKAQRELSAQRELLAQRENRKKLQAPSADELAELVKHGDPSCPKGQAYKPKDSKSEVRCTGPQLVDMPASALKAYFGERRFKLTSKDSPVTLRAEHGGETFVFTFDQTGDGATPRCVTAYAASGVSWQEVTARLTGVAPEKLKLDQPVKNPQGELTLKVEHATDQPKVTLCHGAQVIPAP